MTDSQMQALHDRATRGDLLTDEERAQLEAWYTQQDQAELGLLQLGAPSESAVQLREQVAVAAAQLETISQQIRNVIVENEQVRSDIALLQRQLSQRTVRAA